MLQAQLALQKVLQTPRTTAARNGASCGSRRSRHAASPPSPNKEATSRAGREAEIRQMNELRKIKTQKKAPPGECRGFGVFSAKWYTNTVTLVQLKYQYNHTGMNNV